MNHNALHKRKGPMFTLCCQLIMASIRIVLSCGFRLIFMGPVLVSVLPIITLLASVTCLVMVYGVREVGQGSDLAENQDLY